MPLENTLADVRSAGASRMLPHLRELHRRARSEVTGVSDTPSRRRSSRAGRPARREEARARARSSRALARAGVPRRPVSADDLQDADEVLRAGPRKRRLRGGIRWRCRRSWPARGSCSASRSARRRPHQVRAIASRRRPGVAAVVLPVGHGPGRGAAEGGQPARCAPQAASRSRSGGCSRIPASEALSTRFAAQWLRLQDLDKIFPDYLLYPQYDDTLAAAMQARDRAVLRQPRPRGSQPARPADRRLLVRQRAAGACTTASRTSPAAFRRVTLPDYRRGMLGHGSILTLTSMADRTSPVQRGKWVMEVLLGIAAAAAAAQRADARRVGEGHGRRQAAVGPRAHGGAPQEPGVQLVPPRDRSARPGARELRRHRRLAHQGQRGAVDRGRRLYDGTKMTAGRPARRAAEAHKDACAPQLHREPDDLRARPAASRPTTCRRFAPSCATRPRATTRCRRSSSGRVKSAAFKRRGGDAASNGEQPRRRRRHERSRG